LYKSSFFYAKTETNGTATIVNASEPNKLKVEFDTANLIGRKKSNESNYNVMYTDYTTYSVVYSCTQYNVNLFIANLTLKDEYVWILSRNKTLDDAITQNLTCTLAANGLEVKNFLRTPQNCDLNF
jgi:lipocalin